MKITNLKQLNKRKILKYGDTVEFTVLEQVIIHEVHTCFLSVDGEYNDYIFKELKLNAKEIAKKCYKYDLEKYGSHDWPESKKNDYAALTRLVKRLYEIIEEKYKVEIFEKIESRFEILDIR